MSKGIKILIAEDDRSILEVVTIILEDAGYTVQSARTSDEFFEKLDQDTPSLLLLDIWLSGEDGGKIARHLKETPATANIPTVIISANAETDKIAEEVGADGFLLKPFDIEALLDIVTLHTKQKNTDRIVPFFPISYTPLGILLFFRSSIELGLVKLSLVRPILLFALPACNALQCNAGRPTIRSAAQRAIFGGHKKL